MSSKLMFTLVILQFLTILIKATIINEISKEINDNKIESDEKISQEDSNGNSSGKNGKKVKRNEWNVVVKDLKMIDEQHDKETIEALEEGEIAGVRWDPLSKDISYKILLKQGNRIKNENVSVTPFFKYEDKTTPSSVRKHELKSEEINVLFRKQLQGKTFIPISLPYFKKRTLGNNVEGKKKKPKNKTNPKSRKEGLKSRVSSEIKSVLEEYLKEQTDNNKKFDLSLKSDEVKLSENQDIIVNRSEEITIYPENSEIDSFNREEIDKDSDRKEIDLLNPIDDKYETLLQKLQRNDTQHRDKKKQIENKPQVETLEEIQQVKNYIKKEVEELKSTYDKVIQNNYKTAEKINHDSEEKQEKKIKNITGHWLPIKSDGKTQWTERGPEKKNVTILKYFVPKKLLKHKRMKRKKNRKKYSLSNAMDFNGDGLKGNHEQEKYLININLQEEKDTHVPFVKQLNENMPIGIFNKLRETNKINDILIHPETLHALNNLHGARHRNPYLINKEQIIPFETTLSSKNIEIDIANTYAKNITNKIIAKRQSLELLKKLEDDKNVGFNLLYHFEDFSSPEMKSTNVMINPTAVNFQSKQTKKKKNHKNVHEWFADTKNKTKDYFTKMGKKIKNFFNKKHHAHHEVYLNEAPLNIQQ